MKSHTSPGQSQLCQTRKFSQLILGDHEQLIHDFNVRAIRYFDVSILQQDQIVQQQAQVDKEEGFGYRELNLDPDQNDQDCGMTIYLCSRSLVIENKNVHSKSLSKYMLSDIIGDLQHGSDLNILKMKVSKIVEVPIEKNIPRPYLSHEAKDATAIQLGYDKDPPYFELFFDVEHQDIMQIIEAITVLRAEAKKDRLFENNLSSLIYQRFSFAEHLQNPKFDLSNLKANDDATLIQSRVNLISPLMTIDGTVCIAKQRVYFQPVHPTTFDKPALNLRIERVT